MRSATEILESVALEQYEQNCERLHKQPKPWTELSNADREYWRRIAQRYVTRADR